MALNNVANKYVENAWRNDYFFTWLANSVPPSRTNLNTTACTLCRRYNGSIVASGFGYVNCPLNLPPYTTVIQNTADAICLQEVEVYAGWYSAILLI